MCVCYFLTSMFRCCSSPRNDIIKSKSVTYIKGFAFLQSDRNRFSACASLSRCRCIFRLFAVLLMLETIDGWLGGLAAVGDKSRSEWKKEFCSRHCVVGSNWSSPDNKRFFSVLIYGSNRDALHALMTCVVLRAHNQWRLSTGSDLKIIIRRQALDTLGARLKARSNASQAAWEESSFSPRRDGKLRSHRW